MVPANPPLPAPSNLWFQPAAGSQTSNSMWESADDWMTPVTRQKAGMALKKPEGPSPGGDGGVPGGSVNAPAAMVCAAVIVVDGSFRLARLSQVAANTGAARKLAQTSMRIFMLLHG